MNREIEVLCNNLKKSEFMQKDLDFINSLYHIAVFVYIIIFCKI